MTFIHGYLLAGLLLVGVPVLIHLIMRQKPRVLPFPAFRFLKQKHLINQRKLRLQHLLLLLVRMAIIASLCLALARPRLFSQRAAQSAERAVAAVLLFDTSPSMEYTSNGQTRLDEARQRARELLLEMADGSQVAVFETGDDAGDADAGDWIATPAMIQARIDGLRIRPANGPLNRQIDRAIRLLQTVEEGEDAPPRFLYIFSDRTRGSWDAAEVRKPTPADANVNVVFVDVGVDGAQDLAIDKVEVVPPVVAPGARFQVNVTVRATNRDFENTLRIQIDNDSFLEPREVKLAAGRSRTFVIERPAPTLAEGGAQAAHQVTARFDAGDALAFNNTRCATFLVRQPGKVLAVADKVAEADNWQGSLDHKFSRFRCEVKRTPDAASFDANALSAFKVVCLFQVANPDRLWKSLHQYVNDGGGLVVIPPASTEGFQSYKRGADEGVMPATLDEQLVTVAEGKPGVRWAPFSDRHPLTAFFRKESMAEARDFAQEERAPRVYAYWKAKPMEDSTTVVATYVDGAPSLVERAVGLGRVMLFTTTLDGGDDRRLGRDRPWNNYFKEDSSFGFVLVNEVCRYLAGDSVPPELNFYCGQPVSLALASPPPPPYTLQGPNLVAAEANLGPLDGHNRLTVTQPLTPGNFTVRDGKEKVLAGFSLNVRPEESQLERVLVEEVEAVLGKDSVLPVGRTASLRDALAGRKAPPVELLPYLMMAVLLALTVEGLLANRFYRRSSPAPSGEQPVAAVPRPEGVAP
jgi:hypothetical protein